MRAGEDPAVIAAETGWPLDRVERYAGPPLAERSFIAGQAQAAEVRRSGGPVTLADTVAAAMQRAGLSVDDVSWDAWRREDGRWIVTATAPGAVATWTYDVSGRTVHPLDDSARRLMGVDGAADRAPRAEPQERPRLVAVPERADETERDGTVGDAAEDAADDADAGVTAHGVDADPAPMPARGVDVLFGDDPAPANADRPSRADTVAVPRPDPQPAAKKGKGRRASVPSWDEILFGSPRERD